jgi:hypothetical protein
MPAARAITPDGVYRMLIEFAGIMGIDAHGFGPVRCARQP